MDLIPRVRERQLGYMSIRNLNLLRRKHEMLIIRFCRQKRKRREIRTTIKCKHCDSFIFFVEPESAKLIVPFVHLFLDQCFVWVVVIVER
jgi:hypothetical protein